MWLLRVRNRCGYGVHSPFAFRFITDVVYERTPFYAYEALGRSLPWHCQWRIRRGLELLLRIANYRQPRVIALDAQVPSLLPWAETYLRAGCSTADVVSLAEAEQADLVFLSRPDDRAPALLGERGILILDNLHHHREWFRQLPCTVSFDLYDLGIAFFHVPYYKQGYKVNF